jgi:hypothetical protein
VSWTAAPEPLDAPGPPPLPPADLARRKLPLHVCPAKTRLARIHSVSRDPLFFGPAAGSRPRSRWDAPAGEFRVCYLAEEPYVAFAETFLREPGATLIETADLAARALAEVEVERDLRLVALHGAGLRRLGATAAVCTGPYVVSRAWALALHGHPSRPDGIRYRARHEDDGFAIALFDRAADAIAVTGSAALVLPDRMGDLVAWLDRYGMGLL